MGMGKHTYMEAPQQQYILPCKMCLVKVLSIVCVGPTYIPWHTSYILVYYRQVISTTCKIHPAVGCLDSPHLTPSVTGMSCDLRPPPLTWGFAKAHSTVQALILPVFSTHHHHVWSRSNRLIYYSLVWLILNFRQSNKHLHCGLLQTPKARMV